MNYFIDNDVVIKLAQYDLLDELVECFDRDQVKFFVLETLYYVGRFQDYERALSVFDSKESVARAHKFYKACLKAEISSPEVANLIQQINSPGLDEGELVLIGCALESDPASIVTGDKRAVFAVDKIAATQFNELTNCKFILLEQALRVIIERFGIDIIAEKVRSKPHIDKAVYVCFRGNPEPGLENILQALGSYINYEAARCVQITIVS